MLMSRKPLQFSITIDLYKFTLRFVLVSFHTTCFENTEITEIHVGKHEVQVSKVFDIP